MRQISKTQAELLLTGSEYYNMIYKWLNILPSEFHDEYIYYYYTDKCSRGKLMLMVQVGAKSTEVPLFKFDQLIITREEAIEVGVLERKPTLWERIKRWI